MICCCAAAKPHRDPPRVVQRRLQQASTEHLAHRRRLVEGEYSTLLAANRRDSRFRYRHQEKDDHQIQSHSGLPFPFDVPQSESNWDFLVRSKYYVQGFHGEVWISRATGEVLRIRSTANQIPSGTGI
jgi:hypothetical protein